METGIMTASVTSVSNGLNKNRFTAADNSGFLSADATKEQWRLWASEQSARDLVQSSSLIASHLSTWIKGGATVLSFLPMPGEVDLTELEQLHLHLVTTRTPSKGWLTVHRWDAPREDHRWGFEQPERGAEEFRGKIDVALVPGAAFDNVGHRLGHGRGYYDELLSRLDIPIVIGVCPLHISVPNLPHEDHDVLMTHLVNERGVARLRTGDGSTDAKN